MYPLLQTNFEALSYITDLFLGGIGLLITTLGLAVSIYTFIIAKKAMSDWQVQRNYDVIIESLVEVDNLFNEITELRTEPDRPWNMYATKEYINLPHYMKSTVNNPLFFKYGLKKQSNYDTIIKKIDLQVGDNPILDFLKKETELILKLERLMQQYAENEIKYKDFYDESTEELWNSIFNTSTEDDLSKTIEKEYSRAREWGESKIKSLRANI